MTTGLAAIASGAFIIGLSGALMPGPLFTVTVADSARRGFIAGPLLILGHAILELSLVIAIIFGLGGFLKQPLVMGVIALLGGGVLVWMGSSMVRTAGSVSLDTEVKAQAMNLNPVLLGIISSVSNPYWTLWWATIGLGYLMAALKSGWPGVAAFFIGHIMSDLLWYSAISWGVSRGRKILSQNVYQWAIRVCGVFLLVFGGLFLFASLGYLKKMF